MIQVEGGGSGAVVPEGYRTVCTAVRRGAAECGPTLQLPLLQHADGECAELALRTRKPSKPVRAIARQRRFAYRLRAVRWVCSSPRARRAAVEGACRGIKRGGTAAHGGAGGVPHVLAEGRRSTLDGGTVRYSGENKESCEATVPPHLWPRGGRGGRVRCGGTGGELRDLCVVLL